MRRLLIGVVLASASALWPFSSSNQDPPTPHPDAVPWLSRRLPALKSESVDEADAEGGALVDEGDIVLMSIPHPRPPPAGGSGPRRRRRRCERRPSCSKALVERPAPES